MPLPFFKEKIASPSLVTAQAYIDYQRQQGRVPEEGLPDVVILCYQQALLKHILDYHVETTGFGFLHSLHFLKAPFDKIAVHRVTMAPTAVIKIEELIALGVKRFISIGTAGALDPSLNIGDLVLCTKALRDEGVSPHYLPPEPYAFPSENLVTKMEGYLRENNIKFLKGPTWTHEALYRETACEVELCQKEGILTVDMEAAALFAVAAYHKVEIASLFTISDSLADFIWNPQSLHKDVSLNLETLFKISVEVAYL